MPVWSTAMPVTTTLRQWMVGSMTLCACCNQDESHKRQSQIAMQHSTSPPIVFAYQSCGKIASEADRPFGVLAAIWSDGVTFRSACPGFHNRAYEVGTLSRTDLNSLLGMFATSSMPNTSSMVPVDLPYRIVGIRDGPTMRTWVDDCERTEAHQFVQSILDKIFELRLNQACKRSRDDFGHLREEWLR